MMQIQQRIGALKIEVSAYSSESILDFPRESSWRYPCFSHRHAWHRETYRLHPSQRRWSFTTLRRDHKWSAVETEMAQPWSVRTHVVSSTVVGCRVVRIPNWERSRSFREVFEVGIGPRIRHQAFWTGELMLAPCCPALVAAIEDS